MPVSTVSCNFVGNFKVGDNLVSNCSTLCELVEANCGGTFNKPIVIFAGSILEASLSEIIFRAQNYNIEGVPNIPEVDRQKIAGKKIDKFSVVIDMLKKHHVLDQIRPAIYDDLHRLRKIRNRIHLQDHAQQPDLPRDDSVLFSEELRDWALDLTLEVLKALSQSFSRPAGVAQYVQDLRLPQREPD